MKMHEKINAHTLEKAINFIEKSKIKEEDAYSVIATIGNAIGRKTFTSKYLPKGSIVIGIGKQLPF